MAAHWAPPPLGFSGQGHWSGLPFPSPIHERKSESEVAQSCPTLWRRRWHPTPVLLPGKPHGQRSLEGCSPWDRWGSDTTKWLHFHFSLSCIGEGNGNPLQCSCLENPRDGKPGGLPSMASHRVGHDWSDLAAAAAAARLLVTPWTAAYQAPPSMGFSRWEYWSGVPLSSPTQMFRAALFIIANMWKRSDILQSVNG